MSTEHVEMDNTVFAMNMNLKHILSEIPHKGHWYWRCYCDALRSDCENYATYCTRYEINWFLFIYNHTSSRNFYVYSSLYITQLTFICVLLLILRVLVLVLKKTAVSVNCVFNKKSFTYHHSPYITRSYSRLEKNTPYMHSFVSSILYFTKI